MTPALLATLRAAGEAATKGPWEAYSASCCPDMGGVSGPGRKVCAAQVGRYGHPSTIEDAAFIAHARNHHWDELLDAAEERDRMRDFLERLAHGGVIVSSAKLTPAEIAIAQYGERMHVTPSGLGFAYVREGEAPKLVDVPPWSGKAPTEPGFFWVHFHGESGSLVVEVSTLDDADDGCLYVIVGGDDPVPLGEYESSRTIWAGPLSPPELKEAP